MAAPPHQGNGSLTTSLTASSPGWPSHQINDLGIMPFQTSNQPNTMPTPSGMSLLGQSGIGVAGALGAVSLQLWSAFATSPAMANPVSDDAGDHQMGVISTYRGAYIGRPPVVVGFASGTGTAITSPGGTTDTNGATVLTIIAHGLDSSSPSNISAIANAGLSGVSQDFQNGSTIGNGGGIAIGSGVKASQGTFVGWTATLASSANWVAATVIVYSLAAPSPIVLITSTPPVSSEDTTPTFTFTVSEGTAEYSLDGSGYATTTSPLSPGTLALGAHTLTIRSVEHTSFSQTFAWTIVAAADAVAPTLEAVSPDPGEPPGSPGAFSATYSTAKTTPIIIRIEDVGNGVGFISIGVRISTEGIHFTWAYVGTGGQDGFLSPFSAHSTITPDGGDFIISLRHDDDWPRNSLVRVKSRAVDLSGNVMA